MKKPRMSTSILDEALKNRRKEQEEERLKTLDRIHKALTMLSSEIAFKDAYIFGSVSKPFQFLKGSDIDIGFIGLQDEDFFKTMAFLSRVRDREAVVSQEGYPLVDTLRAFRHFFRHAYSYELDERKVRVVLEDALKLKDMSQKDIGHFLDCLST